MVQAAKHHSTMPVVVVSGYVGEAYQAAEPLADLYLEKPVNPEELVTIVNELLKASERRILESARADSRSSLLTATNERGSRAAPDFRFGLQHGAAALDGAAGGWAGSPAWSRRWPRPLRPECGDGW